MVLLAAGWRKVLAAAVIAAVLAGGAGGDVSADDQKAAETSFIDRFDLIDEGRWMASHGWANGDHQGCVFSARNIKFGRRGIDLLLDSVRAGKRPYACAELQSKADYFYGTYETRIRAGAAPGIVTAFFTYTGPGQEKGRPHHEIDIELLGKNPQIVQVNYFADGVDAGAHDVPLGFDASAGFNTYAFEWLPTTLRWFVNGRLVHEVVKQEGKPFPNRPSRIVISLWSGQGEGMKGWLGEFKYPGEPIIAAYDYVSFTAAGAPCQFAESIVCRKESRAR